MSEQAGAAAADRGDAPAQPLRGDSAGRRLWRQRASEPSGAVRRAAWSGLALTVGQLALMATNLVLSLGLGYAGGLAVVGATAPAVLVFQLTCGVLQRTFAEATLLASAHTGRTGDRQAARWSVAGALLGGTAGGLVAVLASVAVPHAPVRYAVVYAAGIPFAIALDIGRSADVAQGKARAAFADAAVWLTVHIGLTTTFAAVHSPMGICLSWTLVNVVFCAVAALRGYRSPALRGLTGWLRSRRGLMGSASLDALLVGLTPLLALQATALVAPAATVGAIRVLQQLFAPLAFLSIVLRRVLIYLRRAEVRSTVGEDFRDGVLAMLLTVAGGVLLGAAVVLGRRYVAALAFIPAGTAMVAAGCEKAALGFSFGCSLSLFVRGEFGVLLRARYLTLGLAVVAGPLATVWWGAVGYLLASSASMVVYSFAVLARPGTPADGAHLVEAHMSHGGMRDGNQRATTP